MSSLVSRFFCLDLDGVYFSATGKKGFHARLVDLTGTPEKVEYALYKSPEMLQLVTGVMSPEKFVEWFNQYLHTNFTPASLGEFWIKDYEIDPDVTTFIHQLKANGYSTATVSNNNAIRIEALQKRFNFLNNFDVVVFSYETGSVKPNQEIFVELIQKCGVAAGEIVYADDNPERLNGAKELGIKTFIYKSFSQFKNKLYDMGVKLD